MAFDRGHRPYKPDLSLSIPDNIKKLIFQLSKINDASSKWICFSILELDNSALNFLSESFVKISSQINLKFKRFSFNAGNCAISLVLSKTARPHEMALATRQKVAIEKYRLKLDKSLGIGILCSDTSFYACTATLLEFPWQEDDETAELVNEQPMMTPIKTKKLPGRNQPCFCGSHLKFKKCCGKY